MAGGLGTESFSREGDQVAMPHSENPEKARRVTFNPVLTIHPPEGEALEPNPGRKGEAPGAEKRAGPPAEECKKPSSLRRSQSRPIRMLGTGLGLSSESSDKGTPWPW